MIFSIIVGFILQFTILKDEFPIVITNLSKFSPLIVSLIGSFLAITLGFFILKWWKL